MRGTVDTLLELDITVEAPLGAPPLYVANKSNVRLVGKGRYRYGGAKWDEVKAFEAVIRRAGLTAALEARTWLPDGMAWPLDAREYHAVVVLQFGLREWVYSPRSGQKRRRSSRGALARCRQHDVDSVKSILDALNGIAFKDDSQITHLHVRKTARSPLEDGSYPLGDRVLVKVIAHIDTDVGAPESSATGLRSKAGSAGTTPRKATADGST